MFAMHSNMCNTIDMYMFYLSILCSNKAIYEPCLQVVIDVFKLKTKSLYSETRFFLNNFILLI